MYLRERIVKLFTQSIRGLGTNYSKSKLNKLLIDMPKDNKHIAEIKKQRQKIKERSSRYIPGTINLQILGSGTSGSPATIYLFTDQSRYLFNCGEGTQRLAHEHKTKLSRLEHIFMTQTSWSRIGGLPGLSLTVQDAGVPSLALHGPPGLEELFDAMRRFVVLKDLSVTAENCEKNGCYEDAVIKVDYLPLLRNAPLDDNTIENNLKATEEDALFDDTDYYAHEKLSMNGSAKSTSNISSFRSNDLANGRQGSIMCYICKIKPRPGALSLEKCVDKGVQPGPLLGQLKNGFDITLPNGQIVCARDVRAPDDPGPTFIIVDIPSIDYLDDFEKSQNLFEKYQATAQNDDDVADLIVHFTPDHIMKMESYKDFMNKFPPSTRHLVLNETNSFSGYIAANRIQCQLNQLNSKVFPILNECRPLSETESSNKKLKLTDSIMKKPELNDQNGNNDNGLIEQVNSLTCFHLRPFKGIDRSGEAILNPMEYINESTLLPGFNNSIINLKESLKNLVEYRDNNRSEEYPKILFLGTGSCVPNKTRNVSSILIQTTNKSCILFDCGEGTYGQISRFYGEQEKREIFDKLKAVYISHLHADHHIGLIGILLERRKLLGPSAAPIILFAPKQITSWLYFYNKYIEKIENEYILVANGDMISQSYCEPSLDEMGLKEIKTCFVRHCPHSFGITMQLCSGEKITYSGDTMPCQELIDIGKDSTILIHEATMEDELVDQAKYKMHSTVSQAIDQGIKMNAKYTLLTHFSQRYAKLPRLEKELSKNVVIAFDNMEVTISDLDHLYLLYPTLKLLFSEHCEEMEQKALKRAYKQQRAELLS